MPVTAHRATRPGLPLAAGLLSAQLITTLDTSIVNVALPSMRSALRIPAAQLHWVVTAYLVVLGGFLLVCGRLADHVEPRAMLRAGFLLFLAGSVLGALATQPWMLITGRSVQGLAAAIITPAALALITAVSVAGERRLWLLGWWSAVGSIGFAGGGVVGGILVRYLSWQAVMWVNVPLCLLAIALLTAVPGTPPGARRPWPGHRAVVSSALVTTASGALMLVLSSVTTGSGRSTAFIAAAVCLLAAGTAFMLERSRAEPLIPLPQLHTRALLVSITIILLFGVVATSGLFVIMTLHLQDVLRLDPLWTGIAFLPIAVVAALAAPMVERVRRHLSRRALLLTGLGLIGAGLGWLTSLDRSHDYLTGMLPAMVLVGVGFVPVLVIATEVGTNAATAEARGAASGIVNMTSQLAGALGVVLYLTSSANGYAATFTVTTVLTALAFALVALPAVGDVLRDEPLEENR